MKKKSFFLNCIGVKYFIHFQPTTVYSSFGYELELSTPSEIFKPKASKSNQAMEKIPQQPTLIITYMVEGRYVVGYVALLYYLHLHPFQHPIPMFPKSRSHTKSCNKKLHVLGLTVTGTFGRIDGKWKEDELKKEPLHI